MNAAIERLEASLKTDYAKRDRLLEKIKDEETRLKSLKNSELLHRLNEISVNGVDVNKALAALQSGDIDALIGLMPEAAQPSEGKDGKTE